jgi:hypothetical protein
LSVKAAAEAMADRVFQSLDESRKKDEIVADLQFQLQQAMESLQKNKEPTHRNRNRMHRKNNTFGGFESMSRQRTAQIPSPPNRGRSTLQRSPSGRLRHTFLKKDRSRRIIHEKEAYITPHWMKDKKSNESEKFEKIHASRQNNDNSRPTTAYNKIVLYKSQSIFDREDRKDRKDRKDREDREREKNERRTAAGKIQAIQRGKKGRQQAENRKTAELRSREQILQRKRNIQLKKEQALEEEWF